ncbi:MAG TPA: DUF177 domain-containing protein [Devosiaceae bacterium]
MTRPRREPAVLDASIRVDELPPAGRSVEVEANEEQRVELARQLGVSSVDSLHASVTVAAFRGGLRALGRLHAVVVQPCVVSFEPVRQEIDEPVDRIFMPGRDNTIRHEPGAEVFVDLEADDIPDYFEGNELDLSDLLVELLALAIDPYPRAPGASVTGVLGDEAEEKPSAFDMLKHLKDKL